MPVIVKKVNPRFENFIFDWRYKKQLLVGGYGSSKSYHIALKLIMKCCEEVRKVLVVREVYDTHRDSTFSLFKEILEDMGLLAFSKRDARYRVVAKESPFTLKFPNGSKIIFKGMDKPEKLKSLNGVTIVWIEECSEVKYEGYKELLGRLRHPSLRLYFILSTNPVGTDNWVYTHFFKSVDEEGNEHVTLDDEILYKLHTVVRGDTYYHHSTVDDNLFVQEDYIQQLDDLKHFDADLYRVARKGRFGINGLRVLPQWEVMPHDLVMREVRNLPKKWKRVGMDFGFETSYNAIVWMAIDDKNKWLYIYKEYYKNHMTDDKTAADLKANYPNILKEHIVADAAEPKAIQFYCQEGFNMTKCRKFVGSRLANTKKVKRFKRIICSDKCINTNRECSTLTYFKKPDGTLVLDEFNIDPHTLSAIWYGLDDYTVADYKGHKNNSKRGSRV